MTSAKFYSTRSPSESLPCRSAARFHVALWTHTSTYPWRRPQFPSNREIKDGDAPRTQVGMCEVTYFP